MSFAELQQWIDSFPEQVDGKASAICETGQPYVEFYHRSYARPGDEEAIERSVANNMRWQLGEYLAQGNGRIYWRKRLETDCHPAALVTRYDDNGPDIDQSIDRRCFKDTNWITIACYCRLYRAAS